MRLVDADGGIHEGAAVVGCDGVHSVVRQRLIGDGHRVSGHVVYRAVVPHADMPADLRWNAAAIWVGPNCHLVHYPLRGGEQYNIVVTFHSRQPEEWGVREGSRDEVMSYFTEICDRPRQLLDMPTSWKRWSTADRDPVERWGEGRATLLGDAAHPMLQYLAQGACMALEDAVTLREALRACEGDLEPRVPPLRVEAHRARRAPHHFGARDGADLSRQGRRAAGAQLAVGGPHARALLRRARMALRLDRREMPRLTSDRRAS